MEKAVVVRPVFEPGRRIVAVSDIHGNLPFFRALMERVALPPGDILILVGDILEKGRDSLPLLRHLMALSRTHTIYPVCGNCDGLVLNFFETGRMDERFFASYLPAHPESTLRQMAREGGFEQWEDLPRLRRDLRAAFPEEWAWLRAMPTVVETEHLVFVHGGVPSLEGMEELDRWGCMKNDDFLGQGRRFQKWVVVGHWPVTLYNPHIQRSAPILDRERRIASIDGGCVLKLDGQLNALLIPDINGDEMDFAAYDGLEQATALDAQEESADSLNIRWSDSVVEPLADLGDSHPSSGRELWIPRSFLSTWRDGKLHTEDATDYRLPVCPGDRLSLVCQTQRGCLVKKNYITGWYYGRIQRG